MVVVLTKRLNEKNKHIINLKHYAYEKKVIINARAARSSSHGRNGTDRDAADHDYCNRRRASQLQHGECGNRFIQ
jgi:hypothetical protein